MSQPKQVRVISSATLKSGQGLEPTAFFDEDGNPVDIGGGDSGPVTWGSVTGKPDTFPPTIGTTATTARAGNWTPTIAQVTGLQAIIDDLTTRVEALEAE